jgi:amidase
MLDFMVGRSKLDTRTWNIPFFPMQDSTASCTSTKLDGITIGIPQNFFTGHTAGLILASSESAMKILGSAGAKMIDNTDSKAGDQNLDRQARSFFQTCGLKSDIPHYLATLQGNPNGIKSVEDII